MNTYIFLTKSVILCHSLDVENIRVMFAFYSVPGHNSNLEIKIRHSLHNPSYMCSLTENIMKIVVIWLSGRYESYLCGRFSGYYGIIQDLFTWLSKAKFHEMHIIFWEKVWHARKKTGTSKLVGNECCISFSKYDAGRCYFSSDSVILKLKFWSSVQSFKCEMLHCVT